MIDLPLIRQTPGLCGPASLLAVARFYGIETTEQEIARLASTDDWGTDLVGMQAAAYSLGLDARAWHNASVSQIQAETDAGRPVIVNWWSTDDGHYSVAVRANAEQVWIMDPETASVRKYDAQTWDRNWFDFEKDGSVIRRWMMSCSR